MKTTSYRSLRKFVNEMNIQRQKTSELILSNLKFYYVHVKGVPSKIDADQSADQIDNQSIDLSNIKIWLSESIHSHARNCSIISWSRFFTENNNLQVDFTQKQIVLERPEEITHQERILKIDKIDISRLSLVEEYQHVFKGFEHEYFGHVDTQKIQKSVSLVFPPTVNQLQKSISVPDNIIAGNNTAGNSIARNSISVPENIIVGSGAVEDTISIPENSIVRNSISVPENSVDGNIINLIDKFDNNNVIINTSGKEEIIPETLEAPKKEEVLSKEVPKKEDKKLVEVSPSNFFLRHFSFFSSKDKKEEPSTK